MSVNHQMSATWRANNNNINGKVTSVSLNKETKDALMRCCIEYLQEFCAQPKACAPIIKALHNLGVADNETVATHYLATIFDLCWGIPNDLYKAFIAVLTSDGGNPDTL